MVFENIVVAIAIFIASALILFSLFVLFASCIKVKKQNEINTLLYRWGGKIHRKEFLINSLITILLMALSSALILYCYSSDYFLSRYNPKDYENVEKQTKITDLWNKPKPKTNTRYSILDEMCDAITRAFMGKDENEERQIHSEGERLEYEHNIMSYSCTTSKGILGINPLLMWKIKTVLNQRTADYSLAFKGYITHNEACERYWNNLTKLSKETGYSNSELIAWYACNKNLVINNIVAPMADIYFVGAAKFLKDNQNAGWILPYILACAIFCNLILCILLCSNIYKRLNAILNRHKTSIAITVIFLSLCIFLYSCLADTWNQPLNTILVLKIVLFSFFIFLLSYPSKSLNNEEMDNFKLMIIMATSIFLFITAFFDFKMPYVYFQLLRWCVFLCSLVVAYDLKDKKDFIFILFCIIAVLFNPLAPIHMERESWRIVDGIAGFLVLIPLFIKKKI